MNSEEIFNPFDAPFDEEGIRTAPTPPKGNALLAWLVILGVIVLQFVIRHRNEPKQAENKSSATLLRFLELEGKRLLATAEQPGVRFDRIELYEEAQRFNRGPHVQRLCFVVLAGELAGANEASDRISELRKNQLKQEPAGGDDLSDVQAVLERLYADYKERNWDAPSVAESERELLTQRLRWFGQLALAPADGPNVEARKQVVAAARGSMQTLVLAGIAGVAAFVGGFVAFVVFMVMLGMNRLPSRLEPASGRGGIYVETFACWMVLFLLLSLVALLLPGGGISLIASLLVPVVSVAALWWPSLRGVTTDQFRREIGLTRGSGLSEIVRGLIAYAACLPVMALGVIVMLLLMKYFGAAAGDNGNLQPTSFPAHPIVELVAGGGWGMRLLILFLACVTAPVLEEIMFRGLLYRHLRETTARWRVGLSVLFSGLATSLVFAVIHPQGWFAVPVLTALALGFSLVREWRGSLLAPMTMHAANNSLVMILLLMIS